jgi:quercetin dioxygenase-like cupin family protein
MAAWWHLTQRQEQAGKYRMEPVSVAQWEPWGTEPVALDGAGATMRQIFVPAGRISAPHSHPHEQFLRVISGAGQVQCAAGTVELRPGTAIRFAADAWHSAEFFEDTVLLEFNLALGT